MEALAGGKSLSTRVKRIARNREEMLGLLADFSGDDSDRELSFSDLVEAISRPPNAGHVPMVLPEAVAAEEKAVTSKQQQQAAAADKQRRLRRRRSDSRGSCGGKRGRRAAQLLRAGAAHQEHDGAAPRSGDAAGCCRRRRARRAGEGCCRQIQQDPRFSGHRLLADVVGQRPRQPQQASMSLQCP